MAITINTPSTNKSTQSNPVFNQEQYEYLNKTFAAIKIAPGTDHDTIMYNAGQRAVLDRISQLISSPRRAQVT